MSKINLGSGQRPFAAPWINVDAQSKWKPDVVADARSLTTFKDGEAEMFVLHHFIEHLWADDATAVMRECYRVLAPGGSLIILVPDMRELIKGWIRGKIDTQVFLTNVYGAFMGDPADLHRWGYTEQTLMFALNSYLTWTTVRKFDFRPIPGADIAKDWWILGVEAIK